MSLTDQAIERIRESIAVGDLGPGARLPPEPEFARRLGVSRGSLREAVKALAHARVLDVRRGDGTFVTSLEPALLLEGLGLAVELLRGERLLEVMEARKLVEPLVVGLATERIGARQLEELGGHLERMRAAGHDAGELVVHDAAFHDCVVDACGNETLATLLKGLSTATMRARTWRALVEARVAEETVAQHSDILRALSSGDRRLAEATALVHVSTSEEWLRSHVLGSVRPAGRPGRTPAPVKGAGSWTTVRPAGPQKHRTTET